MTLINLLNHNFYIYYFLLNLISNFYNTYKNPNLYFNLINLNLNKNKLILHTLKSHHIYSKNKIIPNRIN